MTEGEDNMGMAIQIMMTILGLIWKVAWFTGAWLVLVFLSIGIWLDGKKYIQGTFSDMLAVISIWVGLVFIAYTTTNNILRLVLQDEEFSIIASIWGSIRRNKEKHKGS